MGFVRHTIPDSRESFSETPSAVFENVQLLDVCATIAGGLTK